MGNIENQLQLSSEIKHQHSKRCLKLNNTLILLTLFSAKECKVTILYLS